MLHIYRSIKIYDFRKTFPDTKSISLIPPVYSIDNITTLDCCSRLGKKKFHAWLFENHMCTVPSYSLNTQFQPI
jgi:hypothetical protein